MKVLSEVADLLDLGAGEALLAHVEEAEVVLSATGNDIVTLN